ncbi:MAG: PA14 domain-containing protein [Verrucomicrobiota bacterium]|jgi:hypothetical protein
MKTLVSPPRTSAWKKLSAALLLAAFGATCALADVVYVTSLPQNCTTTSACGAVQTDGTYTEVNITLGDTGIKGTAVGRPITPTDSRAYLSGTPFTSTTGGVDIKPTLAVTSVYQIHYNWNSSSGNSSTDVVMSATCTGGTLSFSSTPVFQRSYGVSTTWNLVGYLTNTTTTPTISFRYQSGTVNATAQNRLLFDCWRFTLNTPCVGVATVGTTGPLAANSTAVSVTGASSTATNITLYQGTASGNFTNIGSLAVSSPGATVSVPVTGQLVKGAQVGATQTIGGQEGCVPTAGTFVGGGASPALLIAASIRQPGGLTGPIGANGGGTAADIYWIHATGFPVVGGYQITPSTNWQTIAFYPTDSKYLWNSAGDGFTPDPNQYGAFEGFGIASADATDCGPFQIYFDNLRNGSTLIQSFENEPLSQATVLFNQPSFSGTTSANLLTAPNTSAIAGNYASTGTNSLGVNFQFAGLGSAYWLRLNAAATSGNVSTPNAEVDLTQPILVDVLLLPPGQTVAHPLGQVSPANAYQQTNCPGTSATFGVTVTPPNNTTPTYTYAWKHNGTTISGATAATYTKSGLAAADSGTYTVTVSDGVASATLTSLLTVPAPVSIDTQPTALGGALSIGASGVSFSVNASIPAACPCANNPVLTYQWQLNGTNVPGATASSYGWDGNPTTIQMSDAGWYTVLISNTCNAGTATSTPVQLAVTDPNVTPVSATCGNLGMGLLGLYWTNQTSANAFTGPPTWTNANDGPINWDWGTAGPTWLNFAPTDYFVIRWVAELQAPYDAQTYTFYVTSDDGARLWVNGQLLTDAWVIQSATEHSGSIALGTNNPANLILEYFENTGDASVVLSYSSASIYKTVVPFGQFCTVDPNSAIPPRIALSAPANNTSQGLGLPVTLTANVTQESAPVNSVNFLNNGATVLATVAAPGPYTTNWTPPAAGVYNITAQVVYNTTSTLNTETNKLTVLPPSLSSATISNIIGTTLTYGGGAGSQFVLLTTNNLTAYRTNWTRLHTNTATPGFFTIPAVGSGSGPVFYSIKSE